MPTSNNINIAGRQSISNALIPPEGPVALKAILNLTGGAFNGVVDLTQQTLPPVQLSYVQGLYVDNSLSDVELIVTVQNTGQKLNIPAGEQVYTPVISNNPPVFLFACAGNVSPNCFVPVFFLNVPLPTLSLGASSLSGFTFDGSNLLVQDTQAETYLGDLAALISAGGLDVNVISGGGGGGGGEFTWSANAVSPSNTVLYTPSTGKRFLLGGFNLSISYDAFRGGGANIIWKLMDFDTPGNPQICGGYVQVPATAPTSAAFGPSSYTLFSGFGMDALSQTVNGRLILDCGPSLSGGAFYYSFGTLVGDV